METTHELGLPDRNDGVGPTHWDKKKPQELTLNDLFDAAKVMQETKGRNSASQDYAKIGFPDAKEPLILLPIADWHIGSYGTAYEIMTDLIGTIKQHGVRVGFIGDMIQMAIKLRGVLEVMDNVLVPDLQFKALELLIAELDGLGLFSTWDNHSVMREENQVGRSEYAAIFKRHMVWFPHIGHIDLTVGEQTYKLAVSHTFRGRSMYNPVHGQARYMRMEANDREVAIAGDSHVPGMAKWKEGGMLRVALNTGTMQTNSGYGKRFFSLTENPDFPAIVFRHDRHDVTPFWTLREALESAGKV